MFHHDNFKTIFHIKSLITLSLEGKSAWRATITVGVTADSAVTPTVIVALQVDSPKVV